MNNKRLGTKFEKKVVDLLAQNGYWVHFISPDHRGAQPFDIIAVKDCCAIAMDCKTCADRYFRIGRLEENQILAFEKWLSCGNTNPYIIVEHNGDIFIIDYVDLKKKGKIDLEQKN